MQPPTKPGEMSVAEFIDYLEKGARSIMSEAESPEFDIMPMYFFQVDTGDGFQMMLLGAGGDKYEVKECVEKMLVELGTSCNTIGFVSAMWMKDETNTYRTGEGIMLKVETRAGPSHLRMLEVLRSEGALPTVGKTVQDHFDPNPPWGAMGNLFNNPNTGDPPHGNEDSDEQDRAAGSNLQCGNAADGSVRKPH